MPNKAKRLRRKSTLSSVEPVARRITLKNDVGKAPVRNSSLSVLGLKIHRIAIQIRKKNKNRIITQHRQAPSPHPKWTIQKQASPRLQ